MIRSMTKTGTPGSEAAIHDDQLREVVIGSPSFIQRKIIDDQICLLTFDRPNSSANVFDRATMLELKSHLEFIASQDKLKGVIIGSAKKSIFIAGADLHSLTQHTTPESFREVIRLGQQVFQQLADLSIPTVAAIHGACVGGGYELALACDYRVGSSDKATKIGLPETQIGLIPGWGGSTRLPRLIGISNALKIILEGKTVPSIQALKMRMIDQVVPMEYLHQEARQILLRGKREEKSYLANSSFIPDLLAMMIKPRLLKKTRGKYPAVLKALEVATSGLHGSIEESLKLELEGILQVGQTDTCRNLIRIFFLQERARKLKFAPDDSSPTTLSGAQVVPSNRLSNKPDEPAMSQHVQQSMHSVLNITRTTVIGAGVMGAGISQWLSSRGFPVLLQDVSPAFLAKGIGTISGLYEAAVKRHILTRVDARAGMDRISPVYEKVPLKNMDLVIEAAVERMDVKKEIFRELENRCGEHTILATNTSALSISELAASLNHPERVVGIHFFNPVHRMQLVEIVVGTQTDPAVVQSSLQFAQQIGKLPVVVKDSPGFLVNRILMAYLMEAGNLFEMGASVTDLDEAMLDFGMPMGPLRLIDEVGTDIAMHVAETLTSKFSSYLKMPALLKQMVDAKLLGCKTGKGLYLYDSRKNGKPNPAVSVFQTGSKIFSCEELQQRMVLMMLNESARCLEENIVAAPDDVDFGMILGTGFAPFRGGPLKYADSIGLGKIVSQMNQLADQGFLHFVPCSLLKELASHGRKFHP